LIVAHTIQEARHATAELPVGGFVPTMGALHEGHLHLIRVAAKVPGPTVVSIFVNPTQFAPSDDLSRYPRSLDQDLSLAKEAGADWAFVPSIEEMYPRQSLAIVPSGPALPLEGEMRPGHFAGVSLVVGKLFNIIQPQVAVFGLKDLQQCAVIRQLVDELNYPVRLQFEETVREADGLAMSSRNRYFSPEDRKAAGDLPRILQDVVNRVKLAPQSMLSAINGARLELLERGFDVQYLEVVNPVSFETLSQVESGCRLIVAAKFRGVRLIDNWPVM
jgi:pantoate--beta-alanine ligase